VPLLELKTWAKALRRAEKINCQQRTFFPVAC
jgi:hypothetical protein